MKWFIRSLSVLLSVILLVSLFIALPLNVSAISNDGDAVGANDSNEIVGAYDYTVFNQMLDGLRNEYPEGRTWTNSNTYPAGWAGCWAFANICAERIFGYNTPRNSWGTVNVANTLPGDVITTGAHTMFVINVVGNTITVAEGNYAGKIHWGRSFDKYSESFTVYHAPNYDSIISRINQDPIGYVDEMKSENEQLYIRGWTYDPDSPDSPVSLHVYVGDRAGTEASCYTTDISGNTIKANCYRSDHNRYWGFEARINIKERGYQKIYIYAINNEAGNNPELAMTQGVNRQVFINQNPTGYVDEISVENGQLYICGWVYDPDSYDSPVSLHVYVGDRAGTGASCYTTDINGNTIKANRYRPDHNRYWGFEARINIKERGYQNIYIYAINNEGGNNPELRLTEGVNRLVNIIEKTSPGDANNDGNIDVLDAAAIQKYASGKAELTAEQLEVSDVNGDNNVDVLDAAEIQKFAAGIITEIKKKG